MTEIFEAPRPEQRIDRAKIEAYLAQALPPGEPRIAESMDPRCEVCVVIPSFGERELFFRPLESLLKQHGVTPEQMEVIIVVNNSEKPPEKKAKGTAEQNAERIARFSKGVEENQEVLRIARLMNGEDVEVDLSLHEREIVTEIQKTGLKVHVIDKASPGHLLPEGVQHVGGARNRGVAEAVERFLALGKNGLIVQTDADTALADDYIAQARMYFEQHRDIVGAGGYIETEPVGDDPEVYRTHFFVTAARRYRSLLQYHSTGNATLPKGGGFTGSNMISRAFETAYVGGVPELDEREDGAFRERLDTIGKTSRVPEIFARPADRISLRTGGLTKSHGGMRYHQAEEIRTTGQLSVQSLECAEVIDRTQRDAMNALFSGASPAEIKTALTLGDSPLVDDGEIALLFEVIRAFPDQDAFEQSDAYKDIKKDLAERIERRFPKVTIREASRALIERLSADVALHTRYEQQLIELRKVEVPGPLRDLDASFIGMAEELEAMQRAVQET